MADELKLNHLRHLQSFQMALYGVANDWSGRLATWILLGNAAGLTLLLQASAAGRVPAEAVRAAHLFAFGMAAAFVGGVILLLGVMATTGRLLTPHMNDVSLLLAYESEEAAAKARGDQVEPSANAAAAIDRLKTYTVWSNPIRTLALRLSVAAWVAYSVGVALFAIAALQIVEAAISTSSPSAPATAGPAAAEDAATPAKSK